MGTAFVHSRGGIHRARASCWASPSLASIPVSFTTSPSGCRAPMRTRILALFLLAVPLCNSIGSPISAHILLLNSVAGLRGWQWLFLLEGIPAVILGIAAWFLLADGPWSASWLSSADREQIIGDLHRDEIQQPDSGKQSLHVARDCIIYFLWSSGNYGLTFWLPRILTAVGASNLSTGWWATVTFGFGSLAMLGPAANADSVHCHISFSHHPPGSSLRAWRTLRPQPLRGSVSLPWEFWRRCPCSGALPPVASPAKPPEQPSPLSTPSAPLEPSPALPQWAGCTMSPTTTPPDCGLSPPRHGDLGGWLVYGESAKPASPLRPPISSLDKYLPRVIRDEQRMAKRRFAGRHPAKLRSCQVNWKPHDPPVCPRNICGTGAVLLL